MPYEPTLWEGAPSPATPITAERLNNMEDGIVQGVRAIPGLSASAFATPNTDATAGFLALLAEAAVDVSTDGARGHDGLRKPARRVVTIPAGVWSVSQKIILPAGVSLDMMPGAVIRATSAISGALIETPETAWEGQFIRGGVIDCNDLAQDGILIRLGRYSVVRDVTVTDPTRHGAIFGDVGLSASSFEMKVDNVMVRRREGSPIVAASFGINIAKASDSTFDRCVAVGFETGIRNAGGDNRFGKCHVWGYPGAFPITAYLDVTGGHTSFSQCVADSPAGQGFQLQYGYVTLSQCNVFLHPTQADNVVVGVRVDTGGSNVQTFGNRFQGYDAAHRLKADYEGGDTTWLNTSSILGQISAYTATSLSPTQNRVAGGITGAFVPVLINIAGAIGAYPVGTFVAPRRLRFTSISTRRNAGSGDLTLSIERAGDGVELASGILVGSTRAACDFILEAGQGFYLHLTALGTSPVGLTVTLEAYQA